MSRKLDRKRWRAMVCEESLAAFGALMLARAGWVYGGWSVGDIDGGTVQDDAVRLGLLVHKSHTEEGCDDYGEDCTYIEGPDGARRCAGGPECGLLFLADGVREDVEAAQRDADRREGEGAR